MQILHICSRELHLPLLLLTDFISVILDTLCGGDAVKESTEELHDLPGAMRTRTLVDYSTYMTQLIGSESCNPTPSPCHSDKGSPTTHKKVNEQHFYLAFRSSIGVYRWLYGNFELNVALSVVSSDQDFASALLTIWMSC